MGRLRHHDVRTVAALQPERAREVRDVVLVVEGLPEPLGEVAARGRTLRVVACEGRNAFVGARHPELGTGREGSHVEYPVFATPARMPMAPVHGFGMSAETSGRFRNCCVLVTVPWPP